MLFEERSSYDAMIAEVWATGALLKVLLGAPTTLNTRVAGTALIAKLRDAEQAHVEWASAELEALRLDGAAEKCRRWRQDHNPRIRTAEGGSVKTIGGTRQRDADTGRLGASYEQLAFADMERDQLEDHALKLVRDIDAAQLTLAALGRLLKVMDNVPSARTPRDACALLGTTVEAVMAGAS